MNVWIALHYLGKVGGGEDGQQALREAADEAVQAVVCWCSVGNSETARMCVHTQKAIHFLNNLYVCTH